MLASVIDTGTLVPVVVAILSGGFVAAFAAYRKAGPEIESISVTTMRGVIEEMRAELERKDRIIGDLNQQIGEQSRKITEQEAKIAELTERVAKLEVDPPSHLG
jgi:uncharacterized coiled-coil protein SlyX